MGQVAANPSVKFNIGTWPYFVAYLPLVFILLAYVIHRVHRLPSKMASLVGLVGPSVLLFLGGYKVATSAISLSAAFDSTDCVTNPQKYELSVSWKAAASFMKTCKSPSGSTPGTIDDCAGYKDALAKNPSWAYLSHLEKTASCGGWCTP